MRTIAYGDGPDQFAELTIPEGTPKGVVVYFHGGFWRAQYDVSLGRPIAESLAADGWAALNVEYRRNDLDGGYPNTFDDVAAAFDLLRHEGLHGGPIVAMGHSAGGHLAAWAASRPKHPSTSRWVNPSVQATHAIVLGAVLDFGDAIRTGMGEGAVELFMGGEVDARYELADPTRHLPLSVPVWCIHGTDDDIVPPSQSAEFVERSTGSGAVAFFVPVDGDHFVVIDTTSRSWATTLEILATIG